MFRLIIILLLLMPSSVLAASLPSRSIEYLPTIHILYHKHWANGPYKEIALGQIEQESSWKKEAKLETSRELGRGLTQITIAYDSKGKERFNSFKNAVKLKELKDWDWRNDPYNVEYQITFLILTNKSNYNLVRPHMKNDFGGVVSMLVCYNAGYGRWLSRRTVARANGIPDNIWYGGLDSSYSVGETTSIIYGKPLWKRVNEYPEHIILRAKKYKGLMD